MKPWIPALGLCQIKRSKRRAQSRRPNTLRICCALIWLTACSPLVAQAAGDDDSNTERFRPTGADFGGVGLLQMPTGRLPADGEVTLAAHHSGDYDFYTVGMAVYPWLESTIRYTEILDRLYGPNPSFSGNQSYVDKSFDVKLRLLQESYWVPQTAVGFRDIGGTGLFSGEYLAASKRAGFLDTTLGIGWGYLGRRGNIKNPLIDLSSSYATRTGSSSTGAVNASNFFHGPAALYGGVEAYLPWYDLRLKLETDGNNYRHDAAGKMAQKSIWNAGLVLPITRWADITVSYERGNTLGATLALHTNLSAARPMPDSGPAPVSPLPPAAPQLVTRNWGAVAEQLRTNAGYTDTRIYSDGTTVTVYGEQQNFRDREQGQQRAARVLAANVPSGVSRLRIVNENERMATTETVVDVAQLRESTLSLVEPADKIATTHSAPVATPAGNLLTRDRKTWDATVAPQLLQSFGGPEAFYMYQFGLNAHGSVWLNDWAQLHTAWFANIKNNYNKFTYLDTNSDALPQVRTRVREYVAHNPMRMDNLQLTTFAHPASDWYADAYAGYLEMMYAGVGSEVLYRPYASRWAAGVNVNDVRQRNPSDRFGLLQYHVVTGFATLYYQIGDDRSTLLSLSAGRFLAKDRGVGIDVARRFDSGIIAGAYANFSNVSAQQYGEGRFTKGFYISIPFDLMTVHPSTLRANIGWEPLTRDGGQMLSRAVELYSVTDERAPFAEH